jgi:LysR family transcriptional regulator, glycine cleavage system transcriptional activator
MTRRSPPLRALRVFEAAARTGSLTLAADELHITHSAVSQQVKLLEAHFGRPLFVRSARGVEATAPARLLYEEVRAGLDRIALAAEQFAQAGVARSLRINAAPSFAMRWLIPRLSSFQMGNPRIQVLITTSVADIGELKEPFDLIIRRSPMSRPGFACARFLEDVSGPLASPGYLARNPVRSPAACVRASLLHLASRRDAWSRWLARAGVKAPQKLPGSVYEHFFLSLQAASSDLGIAIGSMALCEDDLASGRLVRLFPETVIEDAGFHMLYPEPARPDPALRALVDWLAGQGRVRP